MGDQLSFRTHPFRGKDLKHYAGYMSTPRLDPVIDKRCAAVLEAQGFTVEKAPRSIYKPWKLYEALKKFEPGRVREPKHDEHFTRGVHLAFASMARSYRNERIQPLPLTLDSVERLTSNPGGSAGIEFYPLHKDATKEVALSTAIRILRGEKAPAPCLAWARTQFNDKTRLVWGYPYSMTILEGLFAKPLIDHFTDTNSPLAFAMTTLNLGSKIRVSSYHKRWAYSIDMSSYDASIAQSLIHIAFKIIGTWFDLDQKEPTTGLAYRGILAKVENYFIHTPIVMPDLRIYLGKRHGVPSGSFFTQLIDSIVNIIIAGTISSRFNLFVDKDDILVLGDDLLFWSERDISLEAIASFATEYFGVEFNPEKSNKFRYSEPIHFLGRIWHRGRPTLPIEEVTKRMKYPERQRRYSQDPEQAEREFLLMLYSYGSVYPEARRILKKYLNMDSFRYGGSCEVEHAVFDSTKPEGDQLNPDHLSGLIRFMMKYGPASGQDARTSKRWGTQYWL